MKKTLETAREMPFQALVFVGLRVFLGLMALIGFVVTSFLPWFGKMPQTANGKDVDDYYSTVSHFKAGDVGARDGLRSVLEKPVVSYSDQV